MKLSPFLRLFGTAAAAVVSGPALLAGRGSGWADAAGEHKQSHFNPCVQDSIGGSPDYTPGNTKIMPSHAAKAIQKNQSNKNNNRNLNDLEDTTGAASALENHVVMGILIDPSTNSTATFIATNSTVAVEYNVGFTISEECSDEAHSKAKIVNVSEDRSISTDTAGARGWYLEHISEIEDDETSTVPALTDHIAGVESNYTLVAYLYGPERDLVECAPLKKLDEATGAVYQELFTTLHRDVHAAEAADAAVNADTSSGSKNGVFVFVSAIAAIGIAAVVLGDILAL